MIQRLLFLTGMLILSSCVPKPLQLSKQQYRWPVMGSFFEIQWYESFANQDSTSQQMFEVIRNVDESVSIYKQYSELSLINQHAGDRQWIPIHSVTQELLQLSLRYQKETNGIFNIGVGPLMRLWGLFLPVQGKEQAIPADGQIQKTMSLLDLDQLEIQDEKARLLVKGMELDMGGIAKGYALDAAYHRTQEVAACGYMNLGRQIMVLGSCKEALQFGIQDPDRSDQIMATVSLQKGSLSTSGGYEKYFVHQGKQYSHILDPSSGRPVQNNLRSVTVWMENATQADVFSKVLLVMGYEKGKQFLEKYGDSVGVYWIFKNRETRYQDSKHGKILLTQK